jgi:tripeptide aminopeptidase
MEMNDCINRDRLLQRFLQYVQIESTAVEDSGQVPSSPGQLEMGRLLVQQLREMGISDAEQDPYGIVIGTIPGNRPAPTIAFNSHVDTAPDTSGKGVRPRVIENFDGQDIVLSGDRSRIITAATCPELPLAKGKTLITTDGTTLLGGDDKAGVAIIMELANVLLENPQIPRGPVRVVFTCDEEIGHGTDHIDLKQIDAVVCYNFDGGGQDEIDVETFSADSATITFSGVNIHPAIAKGKMINSLRAAGWFLSRLPADLSPERTDDRSGFIHPYQLEGTVAKSTLKLILRDFETPQLEQYAQQLQALAGEVQTRCPGIEVEIKIVRQYRNMADGLAREPRAVALAVAAHEALGRTPRTTIVRGGTDGSRLTEMGLPTPNLSSGQHNIHSPLEWACLDEMVAATEVGLEIVQQWARQPLDR